MKNIKILFLIIFAVIITGCKTTDADQPSVMETQFAGNFSVVHLGGKIISAPAPTINVDVQSKRISGFLGCNTYSAAYSQMSNNITFINPISTKKACAEGMNVEQTFTEALLKTSAFSIEKTILTFFDKEQNVLLTAKPTDM